MVLLEIQAKILNRKNVALLLFHFLPFKKPNVATKEPVPILILLDIKCSRRAKKTLGTLIRLHVEEVDFSATEEYKPEQPP